MCTKKCRTLTLTALSIVRTNESCGSDFRTDQGLFSRYPADDTEARNACARKTHVWRMLRCKTFRLKWFLGDGAPQPHIVGTIYRPLVFALFSSCG